VRGKGPPNLGDDFDHGNPNKDFREFKSIVKAQQFQQVRKAGGGAKEQERRRRQIAKRQQTVTDPDQVEVRSVSIQDEQ